MYHFWLAFKSWVLQLQGILQDDWEIEDGDFDADTFFGEWVDLPEAEGEEKRWQEYADSFAEEDIWED